MLVPNSTRRLAASTLQLTCSGHTQRPRRLFAVGFLLIVFWSQLVKVVCYECWSPWAARPATQSLNLLFCKVVCTVVHPIHVQDNWNVNNDWNWQDKNIEPFSTKCHQLELSAFQKLFLLIDPLRDGTGEPQGTALALLRSWRRRPCGLSLILQRRSVQSMYHAECQKDFLSRQTGEDDRDDLR